MGGAKVTLVGTSFDNVEPDDAEEEAEDSKHGGKQNSPGISILCHGQGSLVNMTGCRINGGEVGVIVRNGGELQATGLTVQKVSLCGIQGEHTATLKLSDVTISNLVALRSADLLPRLGWDTLAVMVSDYCVVELEEVVVADTDLGILIDSSVANMTDCSVRGTLRACLQFRGGSKGVVTTCSFRESRTNAGIDARDIGTYVQVKDCVLTDNWQCSLSAANEAVMEVTGTTIEGSKASAALRATAGATLNVSKSFSNGDKNPGAVMHSKRGTVVISDVLVDGVSMSGIFNDESVHKK
jgi:hypothetical protein